MLRFTIGGWIRGLAHSRLRSVARTEFPKNRRDDTINSFALKVKIRDVPAQPDKNRLVEADRQYEFMLTPPSFFLRNREFEVSPILDCIVTRDERQNESGAGAVPPSEFRR